MNLNRIFIVVVLVMVAGFQFTLGQTGTITGNVSDAEEKSPLESATVRLMQDGTLKGGAYTDATGVYTIANLKPGTYSLIFTYVSYEADTVADIAVRAGETVEINNSLGFDEGDVVQIYEKIERNTEGQVLNMQRRSTSVVDVISIENIKRAGDSDVGSAMKRVTGVTVEGGKYVYVRGLGDRYAKTLMNGSEIPGLDPDRNSVQMDMFPTNLIQNIVVHKTFSPDLPGDYAGGLVKISTKDFPSDFTVQYTSSAQYNTQSSFRDDFITGERGKLDFLGMDDGTRAIPEILDNPNVSIPGMSFNPVQAAVIDSATKSFGSPIYPSNSSSMLDHSHSFSIGNQVMLKGRPFGFLASMSYNNNKGFYNNGTFARWDIVGDSTGAVLNPNRQLNDTRATREVLMGGLLNMSYLVSENSQIRLNILRNQSGTSEGRYLVGRIPEDAADLNFETRTVGYRQRSMNAFQVIGNHKFDKEIENEDKGSNFGDLKMDWVTAVTLTSQIEPDLSFFSNDFTVVNGDTAYDIQPSLYVSPARYFRDMKQSNLDAKINFEIPFENWTGAEGKFKWGGSALRKTREFRENRYDFAQGSAAQTYNNNTSFYNGNPADYFSTENLGVVDYNEYGVPLYGVHVVDATELQNSYSGEQSVFAGYGMVDLPIKRKLRFVGGMRFERTDINVASKKVTLSEGILKNNDLLPSANLIYSFNGDSLTNIMNLRGSFSRTLARPTFRELAPFASFAFIGDFVLVGNENLERTLIDNFDLRWELFPTTSEIVSVSAFYKRFTNPIERVFNTAAQNDELTFRNVDQARLYGLEFEFRKSLGFIGRPLRNFRASGNLVLIQSQVDISEGEMERIQLFRPNAGNTRAMFGQSPFSINGELAYVNDSLGLNTSLNFNVFGARIASVSSSGAPNIIEQPRPSLDFSIGKSFGEYVSVKFKARNLLNPEYRQTQTLNDFDYVFQNYTVGRTYSLQFAYTFRRRVID